MKGFAERRRVRLHPVSRMWKTTSTRRNTTVLLGVLGEPVGILVDKLIAPLGRGDLKENRGHLVGRLARDALIGFLRFPGIGDAQRNCWLALRERNLGVRKSDETLFLLLTLWTIRSFVA
jgi:hypothetical protein